MCAEYLSDMLTFSTVTLFAASRLLLSLVAPSSLVEAVPTREKVLFANATTSANATASAAGSTGYWLADIRRQGTVAFGNSNFQIYRNVKDFGAVGEWGG